MQTVQSNLFYFTAKSLYMFRVSQHPSSRVLKTVTAASGTVQVIISVQLLPSNVATLEGSSCTDIMTCTVPEAAVTVFSTPDGGCGDTRNMWSDFAVK